MSGPSQNINATVIPANPLRAKITGSFSDSEFHRQDRHLSSLYFSSQLLHNNTRSHIMHNCYSAHKRYTAAHLDRSLLWLVFYILTVPGKDSTPGINPNQSPVVTLSTIPKVYSVVIHSSPEYTPSLVFSFSNRLSLIPTHLQNAIIII